MLHDCCTHTYTEGLWQGLLIQHLLNTEEGSAAIFTRSPGVAAVDSCSAGVFVCVVWLLLLTSIPSQLHPCEVE